MGILCSLTLTQFSWYRFCCRERQTFGQFVISTNDNLGVFENMLNIKSQLVQLSWYTFKIEIRHQLLLLISTQLSWYRGLLSWTIVALLLHSS